MYGGSCSRLIVNRFSGNQIFALTEYSGLFFSNDTGNTWKSINGSDRILAGERIIDLEITKDNKIFIPLWSRKLDQYTYLTTDDFGITWQRHQCPDSFYVKDFEYCNDGTIYIFTRPSISMLYRSTNAGTTWQKIDLPDTISENTRQFYVDREDSKIIFLFGRDAIIEKGLFFRTSDGGKTWNSNINFDFDYMTVPVRVDFGGKKALIFDAINKLLNNYYQDIYVSSDNGVNWKNMMNAPIRINSFTNDIPSPAIFNTHHNLLTIINNRLCISHDTGRTFNIIPSKFNLMGLAGIGNKLIGNFSFSGMQSSGDEGVTWTPSSTNYGVFYDCKLSIANSNVFFSIVDEQSEMRSQLRQSTDAGNTWRDLFDAPVLGYLRTLNAPSPRYFVIKSDPVSVDSKSAGMLLTGTVGQEIPDTLIKIDSVASPGGGYYHETFDLQISPLNQNIIYFEMMTRGYIRKLFVSTNSGINWEKKTVPGALFREFSLYPSYVDTNVIYGAGGQAFSTQDWGIGIWRSSDYGATWKWLKWYDPFNEFRLLQNDIFYDGTTFSFSSDNGSMWTSNTNGLPNIYLNPKRIRSFYSNHTLISTTPACNFFQYKDYGWIEIAKDNDLKLNTNDNAYYSSEIFISGSSLYVSYNYDGLYVNRNSITQVKQTKNELSEPEFYNLKTYPNPFTDHIKIFFEIKKHSFAKASIFTTTGKCIRKFFFDFLEKGYHEFLWDGKDEKGSPQQNGLFFCRIETESFSINTKLILLR